MPSIGNAATTTCSIPQACALFNNTSTGYGVEGEANSGIGVYGLTTGGTGVRGSATTGTGVSGASTKASGVAGSSSSGAGVSGTSASGTVANAGVIGTSTYHTGADSAATFGYGNYPAYGMVAYGTKYGALGRTENAGTSSPGGYGVAGMDSLGSASHDVNAALFGYSAHGTGMVAEAGGTRSLPFFGIALAFDYRIVAKPFDNNGARLANAPAMQKPRALPTALSRRHTAVPLTPEEQARALLRFTPATRTPVPDFIARVVGS